MNRTLSRNRVFALVLLAFLVGFAPWSDSPAQKPKNENRSDSAEHQKMIAKFKREFADSKADPRTVARAWRDAAQDRVNALFQEVNQGRTNYAFVLESCRELKDAELALANTKAERVAALEKYWLVAKAVELTYQAKHEAGTISTTDYAAIKAARLRVEYEMTKAMKE